MSLSPFPRKIVFGSLLRGRARIYPVFAALTLAAMLSTALFNLYADLDAKLHREFRVFGPNLSMVAKDGGVLPVGMFATVPKTLGPEDIAVASAFVVAQAPDGTRVVVVGAGPRLLELNPSWKVDGGFTGIFVGHKAWDALHLGQGTMTLRFHEKDFVLESYRMLTTGGPEDERIYIPLASFATWTSVAPSVVDLRVNGRANEVESKMAALQVLDPGVRVSPLRQVTETQTAVFEKSSGMLGWASAMVVVVLLICAGAAISSSVLERRRDYAVMRALGASVNQVRLLLLRETVFVSVFAALVGFSGGCLLAAWIGKVNFGTTVQPRLVALELVFPATVAAGILSTVWPLIGLSKIQPAALLKGE